MRPTSSEKLKLWSDRLSRFHVSGQTVAAFCRSEGFSQPSFYQWKKKLAAPRNNNSAETLSSSMPSRAADLFTSTNAFQAVELGNLAGTPTTIRLSDYIEIQLGSDLPTVATVIDQLAKHVDSTRKPKC